MVYLIHFETKLAHAQHYIGFVEGSNLDRRIERHRAGNGSRLLRAVNMAGIPYQVVRTWLEGDKDFERSLKNKKKASQFCPVCNKKLICP